MAVVVNEMEVTPAASEGASLKASPGEAANAKPLDPREVECALVKQMERRNRVRAH